LNSYPILISLIKLKQEHLNIKAHLFRKYQIK
jgi:hypothetical protein